MHFLLILLIATVAIAETPARLRRSESVLVRAVKNGDTVDVEAIGRVHLLGIAAPKVGPGSGTALFGRQARDRLADLVLHHWVRLEYEGNPLGGFSRRAAYLWREDGVFVNVVLVREGLARVSSRLPLVRLTELQGAEDDARTSRRGIWGTTSERPLETVEITRHKVVKRARH